MGIRQNIALSNRCFRHIMFWIVWITGFTFIKSYGAGSDIYLGWLTYYIVTLPVFILHTYLIVYWAARRFLSGFRIPVFIVLFFLLMVLFSFLEMIITSEFLSGYFPYLFSEEPIYLNPAEVVISGIGNLYIILVFSAAKMIRSWHLKEKKKQEIMNHSLLLERADVNAGIHPRLLLFSLETIETLTSEGSEIVSSVIIHLSDLLNSLMNAGSSLVVPVEDELHNVEKLLKFYGLLLSSKVPTVTFEGIAGVPASLSASIVFLPLEIIMRYFRQLPEEMTVRIHHTGFVEISWSSSRFRLCDFEKARMLSEMEEMFPRRFFVDYDCKDHQTIVRVRDCNMDRAEQVFFSP